MATSTRFSVTDVLTGRAGIAELIDVRVASTWRGGLESEVRAGRHRLTADEPAGRGGDDAGPTPLQLVLSGLCACETVTMQRLSRKLRMQVDGFEIEAHGIIDARGRNGEAPVPAHFLRVEVRAHVRTPEPVEGLKKLQDLVERHCPVATLLRAASVEFVSNWDKVE